MRPTRGYLDPILVALVAIASAIAAAYFDGETTLVLKRISPTRVDAEYTTSHWLGLVSVEHFDLSNVVRASPTETTAHMWICTTDDYDERGYMSGDPATASTINDFIAFSLVGQNLTLHEFLSRYLAVFFAVISTFLFVVSYKSWPGTAASNCESNGIPPTDSTNVES
jgi:hypothetical protein